MITTLPAKAFLPAALLSVVVLVAIFADVIAPYSPIDGDLSHKLMPPFLSQGGSTTYLLGTDFFGRDGLSRLVFGTRVALIVAALGSTIGAGIGTVLGLISGYAGGKLDSVLMRIVDIGLSIPLILIAIVLATVAGPSFENVIIIISVLLWPRFARQIRAETVSIKQQPYVELATVVGCSKGRILIRHIFPNVVPTLIVLYTLNVGYVILLESMLSFLGVGIPRPTPSLGSMVADGRGLIASAWWISLFPGLAISLICMSANFLGDWVRDRLDPKLRQV